MCREFIKEKFPIEVLEAYDTLVPPAFKADLWRLCILYVYGGFYLDIKYTPVNGWSFNNLEQKEQYCKDRDCVKLGDKFAVYNAFLCSHPGNQVLEMCIKQIVKHVNGRFYGSNPLDVTGPRMMIHFVDQQLFTTHFSHCSGYIVLNSSNQKIVKLFTNEAISTTHP